MNRPGLAQHAVQRAFAHLDNYKFENPIEELTALVALVRLICGFDEILTRHSESMRWNSRNRILKSQAFAGEKIPKEMMRWLRIVRTRPVASFIIEHEDSDPVPFNSRKRPSADARLNSASAWTASLMT